LKLKLFIAVYYHILNSKCSGFPHTVPTIPTFKYSHV
jgi:hypothetical protein